MLGRLIQGHSKGAQSLESATEEQHTRSLLWRSQPFDYSRSLSPPATPVSSPTFRVGPFDDRGGLELNETRDARIIVAQDSFGPLDRPLVLFDSHKQNGTDAGSKSPRPTSVLGPAESRISSPQSKSAWTAHNRSRSTTASTASSPWSRPVRDTETGDSVHQLLESMFGVTGSTKSESSTKMHILSAKSSRSGSNPSLPPFTGATRVPMPRSKTATQISTTHRSIQRPPEIASEKNDIILITRTFAISLSEAKTQVQSPGSPTQEEQSDAIGSRIDVAREADPTTGKKPKLIEKRIPMFAVGILLSLPNDSYRSLVSRPPSRASMASSSFPNSLGSDIASSWTLLETLPESLASSLASLQRADLRMDAVTGCWDIILRALASLEYVAKIEVGRLLQQVDQEMMASFIKVPKGPQEQRTNQRNIYIRSPMALSSSQQLHFHCRQSARRICYALRIPKVVTGTGFADGHWLDEARYLVSVCGSKAQNFFVFNLLTAFLGNHMEWLEKLGLQGFRNRNHSNDRYSGSTLPSCRTIIVAERRSLARRLIFLLASFLPTPAGVNAFDQATSATLSPLPTPALTGSSPTGQTFPRDVINPSLRRGSRSHHVSFGAADFIGLSTSASSTGSTAMGSSLRRARPTHQLARKDSDTASIRTNSFVPIAGSSQHSRKTSAAQSAIISQPATPLAHLTTVQDSYFPEQAIVDGTDSVASADLARILRRDSSGFAPSSVSSGTWSSFLGGMLNRKSDSVEQGHVDQVDKRSSRYEPRPSAITRGSTIESREPNKLESMVGEVSQGPERQSPQSAQTQPQHPTSTEQTDHSSKPVRIDPPRMKVDEDDGVIDVDMGIAGFIDWDQESKHGVPGHVHGASTSLKSNEGFASSNSSVCHVRIANHSRSAEGLSVAGFLKRYHEDLDLQSVRPYDGLMEEIKQSMSREANLVDSNRLAEHEDHWSTEDNAGDRWYTLSSTLVADIRTFTIKRLTLQRKVVQSANASRPTSPQITSHSEASPHGEERFLSEAVMDFDLTLTDAIEGILEDGNKATISHSSPSATHKRNTSASTTYSTVSTPPTSVATNAFSHHGLGITRVDCRQVVADALEEVVKSVDDDIHGARSTEHSSKQPDATDRKRKDNTHAENALREGVKQWLLNAETRSVW